MKKVLLFASAVIAAAVAFSCNPEEPTVEASLVLKSQEAVEIPAEGASVEVSFVTNQDWTVKSDSAWATVDPAQGKAAEAAQTVKVEVAANDTEAERTATITVKASTIEKKVTVKQAAKAAEVVTSIATALATPGTYTIQGQVLATCTKGAVIADATAAIYVYKADAAAWEVGATYKVTGPTCVFDFGPELNGFESAEKVSDGTVPAAEPTAISVEVAEALIASIDGKDKSKDLVLSCQYVQIEGTLAISGTYYNVTIAGTDKAVASISYPAESLGLAAYDGKNIKVTGYLTSISGGKYLNIVTTAVEEGAAPTQPTGISSAADYVAFVAAVAAGDSTAYRNAAGEVDILADLDFTGVAVGSVNIQKFKGVINGNGHSIKNLATTLPLFDTLDVNSAVKNLVIDASCKFEYYAPESGNAFFGPIANVLNGGQVDNVTNNAEVSVAGYPNGTLRMGGIIGHIADGNVTNCINNGQVGCNMPEAGDADARKNFYIGGIAGTFAGDEGEAVIKDCTNNGKIISIRKNAGHNYVGGIVGSTYTVSKFSATLKNRGTIKGCTNTGEVYVENKANASGTYANVGGVVGYMEASIEGCTNKGNVTLTCDPDRAASCTRPAVGGVAGYVTFNATDCVNEGTVTVAGVWAAGTADAGGAGGYPNPLYAGVIGGVGFNATNTASCTSVVSGCRNKGTLNVPASMKNNGKTAPVIAGIVGFGNANFVDCHNEGDINVTGAYYKNYIGGITGYLYKTLENCSNNAAITVVGSTDSQTNKPHYQDYIAGLVGFTITNAKITGCENGAKAVISYTNGWNANVYSYVGGITGSYDGYAEMKNCKNLGSVISETPGAMRVGGLSGSFNGIIDNCQSIGKVVMKNATSTVNKKDSSVGIMLGYVSGVYTNCVAGGTIEFVPGKVAEGFGTYASLFVGHVGTARKDDAGVALPWTNNTLQGEMTSTSGEGAYVGVAFGRVDAETASLALGTAEAPSKVKSAAKINGKTIKEYLAAGGSVVGYFVDPSTSTIITDGVVTFE